MPAVDFHRCLDFRDSSGGARVSVVGPAKSTDATEYQKLRGMRKPEDDVEETGLGAEVVSRAGDDHHRYRQLSASSRQDSFVRAAR